MEKDKKLRLGDTIDNARELTLLELNNIRLDVKHTVLTPDYLESLGKSETSST